jgi:hypothetical protein
VVEKKQLANKVKKRFKEDKKIEKEIKKEKEWYHDKFDLLDRDEENV